MRLLCNSAGSPSHRQTTMLVTTARTPPALRRRPRAATAAAVAAVTTSSSGWPGWGWDSTGLPAVAAAAFGAAAGQGRISMDF